MAKSRKKRKSPKRVLALLDLEQAKSAVLNTLTSKSGQRTWRMEMPGPCSVRLEPQFGNSLNPRPLRIKGTHFSARAALVFACFADETCKMYDFLRPGVSLAKAVLRTALSSSILCNSSGIGYSEGFFKSIFVRDSSNSMAS